VELFCSSFLTTILFYVHVVYVNALYDGTKLLVLLYTNIDLTLPNKLHGPIHYKIGDTCVCNGHVFNTLL